MSVAELNKRLAYIKSQSLKVQEFLKPKINEKGFWLTVKYINN